MLTTLKDLWNIASFIKNPAKWVQKKGIEEACALFYLDPNNPPVWMLALSMMDPSRVSSTTMLTGALHKHLAKLGREKGEALAKQKKKEEEEKAP
jgi:hypothetical protein